MEVHLLQCKGVSSGWPQRSSIHKRVATITRLISGALGVSYWKCGLECDLGTERKCWPSCSSFISQNNHLLYRKMSSFQKKQMISEDNVSPCQSLIHHPLLLLLLTALVRNPDDRPSAPELQKHPYLV